MKVGVIILILLLGTVLVRAELSVSCTRNSDCSLALADDAYNCVESFCEKEKAQDVFVLVEAITVDLEWNILSIQEKEQACNGEGCLSFAPEKERSTFWLFRFFRFVLYL